MKRIVVFLLCLLCVVALSACHYSPPEGFTKEHHSYEEVMKYAKSVDMKASVKEQYNDIVDENDWKYREWDATINDIDCHVASVSEWVWNDGFAAGEFAKDYYRIDTDYDYVILTRTILDNYQDWVVDSNLYSKYHRHNVDGEFAIYVELKINPDEMMDDNELQKTWDDITSINEEFQKTSLDRSLVFSVPSPEVLFNHHGEEEYFVNKNGDTYFDDFTEQGKKNFYREYKEAWELLNSDLPVYEVNEH